jgi:hypothetical protein
MLKAIAGVMVATGLFLAGCDGPEPQSNEEAQTSAIGEASATLQNPTDPGVMSQFQCYNTGVWCTDKRWRIAFYSDATYTTVVGYMTCNCYAPEQVCGQESDYNLLVKETDCSVLY